VSGSYEKGGAMKIDSEELDRMLEYITDMVPFNPTTYPETFDAYNKGWYEACREVSKWLEEKEREL
jgi:hypothetical protein